MQDTEMDLVWWTRQRCLWIVPGDSFCVSGAEHSSH